MYLPKRLLGGVHVQLTKNFWAEMLSPEVNSHSSDVAPCLTEGPFCLKSMEIRE